MAVCLFSSIGNEYDECNIAKYLNFFAWFFPAFWPWNGFSVLLVSYYRIVTALESRAAPCGLLPSDVEKKPELIK